VGRISDFDKSGESSKEDADFCLQMWKRAEDELVKQVLISGKVEHIFGVTLHGIEEDTTGQKPEEINTKNTKSESPPMREPPANGFAERKTCPVKNFKN
jgi:hypothetical protein